MTELTRLGVGRDLKRKGQELLVEKRVQRGGQLPEKGFRCGGKKEESGTI